MEDESASSALVTGCAGLIASRTADLLLDAGVPVVGVDNLNDYYDVALKLHRLDRLRSRKGFTFVGIDIEDKPAVDKLFSEHAFSVAYNLAARAGVRYSIENPHVYFSTNVVGSLNLLEAIRRHGTKKYVLASTSSLYAGQPMPFIETLPVNTPLSPYAASKKASEVLAYTYHQLFGIDVSIVRYFTVYGPAGRPDMSVFRFIRWIDQGDPIQVYGDGSQARDFTYVDDIARGTIDASRPLGYEIINLGGGNNPVTLLELIGKIERQLDKEAVIQHHPFHRADMKVTWANIDKAARLLEWRPEVSLDDGIARTVRWYRDNLPFAAKIKV
ncbi:dTDP-glucose 4,6-dehydratase [Posidoniimonas corsicana]|uniref:dTDP-glucose 4,6-dehydratase n=1 Tax=Posidoniimonas corsicana TaxID=1938618 RepID=A0A5C5V5G1_9BACT|nr:GDP-mannose 4,6-dehydratase [Posidoniimonas corsicana]TWT33766.1 dTDP-glucose 4,6-dehydratase [Posidoniimonas corsicana]